MNASADAAPAALASALVAAGFNLLGQLPIARYDALAPPAWQAASLLPSARTAVVVGAGGRALFAAFSAAPEAAWASDPLDAYTRRLVEAAAGASGGRAVFAWERRGGVFADFVRLGLAAGLGARSRLGLLLHPVYGPWMSLRAVILTPLELPESRPLEDFDPCPGCPAPCAGACPGAAVATGGFDAARCSTIRNREAGCRERCDARRACVIGPEHAYTTSAEAHHMRALPGAGAVLSNPEMSLKGGEPGQDQAAGVWSL